MSRISISNFYQGISRSQPPQRRIPGQLEDATNAHFDVLDGARKRNPFVFSTGIDPTIDDDLDATVINLAGIRIFISGSNVSAFNENGASIAIEDATHTNFAYLANMEREDCSFVVALDTAIVCNRTKVVAADDQANFTVQLTVNVFSELPPSDTNPGAPVTNGYYRVLTRENSDPAGYYQYVSGSYVRVPPPGDVDAMYDLTTMPHRFVYDRTNNLITYDTIPFKSRLSGSAGTNLILPIVGGVIKSVNYFQSRLVLLGEDSLNLSYNSDIFQLFVNDVNNIVVQDRISKDILETNLGSPLHTAVIGNTLIVTCENAVLAFDAQNGTQSLTNANGALRKVADIKCLDITPTSNGSRMVIGDIFNEIKVLSVLDPNVGLQLSGSLNDYDPSILEDLDIRQILANEDTVFVLGENSELFVHDSKIQNGQFVQLAWGEYTSNVHHFVHMDAWRDVIRLVSTTNSTADPYAFIEYRHRKPINDGSLDFRVRLDSRELVTGTYVPSRDETYFDHSVEAASLDYSYAVSATTGEEFAPTAVEGSRVWFPGKITGNVYLGFIYDFSVSLTKLWAGSNDIRVMGSKFSVFYTDTSDFDLVIGRENGAQRRVEWQNSVYNNVKVGDTTTKTGVFTTFVLGDLRYTNIKIESSSPGPLTINAVGYKVNPKGGK